MAKLFLDPNDSNLGVYSGTSNVYGSSGIESIILDSGVTNVTIDANVEGVQFSGELSTYTFKQTGNRLEVYASNGTTLISKIGLQGDSNGTQLTFTDGVFDAKYAPAVSSLNLMIGGQTVSSSATPTAITNPANSASAFTYVLTGGTENITGAAGDDTVNVGAFTATGTYALDTGNDTIIALTGANIAGVNSGAATTAESLMMAGTVTMTAAQYAGFASIMAVGASDHIVLTTQATGLTLNPSIESFTLGDFANSVTLSGTGQAVVGGTGADMITGGAGSDTITGGAGFDTITGGAGGDKIILNSLPADADTITGFVTGIDILDLSASLTPAILTIGTQIAHTGTSITDIAAITTAANTDVEVYYISNPTASALTLAQIETALAAGSAATGQATILLDNGTDTFIYIDTAVETDAGAGAGLILIATLVGVTGTTALGTGDLVSV